MKSIKYTKTALRLVLGLFYLAPDNLLLPIGMLIIHLILGWYYRNSFVELLKVR